MPSPTPSIRISSYSSPGRVSEDVLRTLRASPCRSNILLPLLEKAREEELSQQTAVPTQVWIVCTSTDPAGKTSVDFVLSCTQGPSKSYPIFITPMVNCSTGTEYVRKRLSKMAYELLSKVQPGRVFSVFAPDVVTDVFCGEWAQLTGIGLAHDPVYYHAWFMRCTPESLKLSTRPALSGCQSRLATTEDTSLVGDLCYQFALDSPPFVLTQWEARKEADLLIKKEEVWVCEVSMEGKRAGIASIVAVTRSCKNVAAITKVYTHPDWRMKGYAETLVRHVTTFYLQFQQKKSVVLYVGRNKPALKVYERVGFNVFDGVSSGIASWKELGFDRQKIELGHW